MGKDSLPFVKTKVIERLRKEKNILEEKNKHLPLGEKKDEIEERIRKIEKNILEEKKEAKFPPQCIYLLSDLGWIVSFESGNFDPVRKTYDKQIFDTGVQNILSQMWSDGKGMFRYEIQEYIGFRPVNEIRIPLRYLTEGKTHINRMAFISGYFHSKVEEPIRKDKYYKMDLKEEMKKKIDPVLRKKSIMDIRAYDLKKRGDNAFGCVVEALKNYWEVTLMEDYRKREIVRNFDPLDYKLESPIYYDEEFEIRSPNRKEVNVYSNGHKVNLMDSLQVIREHGDEVVKEKREMRKEHREKWLNI